MNSKRYLCWRPRASDDCDAVLGLYISAVLPYRVGVSAKVAALLACRAESTRLYAKPLQLVGDRSILQHLLERLAQVRRIDEIVLAISDSASAPIFVAFARERALRYILGPEQDVLGRLIAGADAFDVDVAVRVTTENPYIYWENLDTLISDHLATKAALSVTTELPVGSAVEVVSVAAWREVHRRGTDRQRRQAPSEYLLQHRDRFTVRSVAAPADVAAPELRLTVDSPEDLQLVRLIWDALHPSHELIPLSAIVTLLRARPDLVEINGHLRAPYLWSQAAGDGPSR